MNSKQINFFLAPDELSEVIEFLKEMECQLLKRGNEHLGKPVFFEISKKEESTSQILLSKKTYQKDIYFEYIASKDYFYIDIVKSYCIEFSTGGFYPSNNTDLHVSRLYFVYKYYENNSLVEKSDEFVNWANDIFEKIRKKYLKKDTRYTSNLVSHKFIEWLKESKATKFKDGTKFITW